jgi:NAD(P)-dependent dehydrogenase (short-subunit alcohol dehydrogenase family)
MNPLDMFNLKGKTALVTGAAGGIASALSKGLAGAGANLIAADMNIEGARKLADEINVNGGKAAALHVDVTEAESIKAMVKAAIEAFGRVDIFVPAAGISKPSPVVDMNEDEFDLTMAINVRGVALCTKYVGKHMIEAGGGSIINIGSLGSERALGPGSLSYVASKGAVAMMTKSLANDWGDKGVRVNGLIPGYFRTALLIPILERDADKGAARLAKIPMKRWGETDDLVGATIFLASDASAYITGHLIAVDGGYLAR